MERKEANLRLEAGDCSIDSSCPCEDCEPDPVGSVLYVTFQYFTLLYCTRSTVRHSLVH